ncbi:MAG: hypothetical protein Q7J84_16020 [Sulfuricaulis sp.]|nr:hypothetical protein [Sulfuricaulis sp.]
MDKFLERTATADQMMMLWRSVRVFMLTLVTRETLREILDCEK